MEGKRTCDVPGCEEDPVVRVYLSIQKQYLPDGSRRRGNWTRGMGGADLCRTHFDGICDSNVGFYSGDMWLPDEDLKPRYCSSCGARLASGSCCGRG